MRLPILVLHICAGILGLLSGAAAISFRKGSRRHVLAGNVFVISMMGMSTAGAYLAFMKHEINNVFGGILAFYLVTTAWSTARRKDGKTGIFDWSAVVVALAVGAAIMTYGFEAAQRPTRSIGGVPAGMFFFLGSVALLSAAGDIRMLMNRGVFGVHRVARHLWRMCFSLFIATGSFFLGQQQIFPHWLRQTNVLVVPAILPLILLIFWMIRVRFTNAFKKTASLDRAPADRVAFHEQGAPRPLVFEAWDPNPTGEPK
jgi:hypothetical protein